MALRDRLMAVAVKEHACANLSAVVASRSSSIRTLSASRDVSEGMRRSYPCKVWACEVLALDEVVSDALPPLVESTA